MRNQTRWHFVLEFIFFIVIFKLNIYSLNVEGCGFSCGNQIHRSLEYRIQFSKRVRLQCCHYETEGTGFCCKHHIHRDVSSNSVVPEANLNLTFIALNMVTSEVLDVTDYFIEYQFLTSFFHSEYTCAEILVSSRVLQSQIPPCHSQAHANTF